MPLNGKRTPAFRQTCSDGVAWSSLGGMYSKSFRVGLLSLALGSACFAGDSLAVLDESDPFYVDHTFPKLTTPQWIGDSVTDAVVVLAIDDMREPEKYEAFLRPIIDRLKAIDGKSHVSIMSNAIDPSLAHYQDWLNEGVSLEVHTLTHPCPLLSRNDFSSAENTFFGGIDLLNHVPGNVPVAYRMPCCDSINSPSPRFYAELFNRTNPAGQFLQIDSSVMCSFTPKDPELPKEWVLNENGEERFARYLPFESFVTTIENYPYPYLIGGKCWEFPCMVPSDWEAQNIQGNNHPDTVRDWKIALDLTVLKKGVFNLVFHPHGWITSEQVIELIDYAKERYGDRVAFLNFDESLKQLNENLLVGQSVRDAHGRDNGVRLADLNADGYQDVVIGNGLTRLTRVWEPTTKQWKETGLPVDLVSPDGDELGVKFGRLDGTGKATMIVRSERLEGAWSYSDEGWTVRPAMIRELRIGNELVRTSQSGQDTGLRIRDLDGDGQSELIGGAGTSGQVIKWLEARQSWEPLGYSLPSGITVLDGAGRDNGVRFVDVNGDGFDDLIQSNSEQYSLHLFIPETILGFVPGWSREVVSRKREGQAGEIPPIVRDGERRNNGAWFHSDSMWIQNEETAAMPDLVDRLSFGELLTGSLPEPLSPQKSIEAMLIDQELTVELVASEPLIFDPVYFDWSSDGRLWVVEMGDYPMGIDGDGKSGGKVRTLRDSNGDGIYDESVTFLEGLNFPTGLFPWGKGLLVTAAPDIIYAEDRNGDGIADFNEVWFTGFREGNQQHRVNGLSYGLDNWLYGANGDSDGVIRSLGGGLDVNIAGRDFRFNPRDRAFEAIEGRTQFGRHRDDWGNWFGNNNPNWLWHYWFPERYLRHNPDLVLRSNKRYLGRNDPFVHDVGVGLQRFNDVGHRNHVTSGNSPTPYRDVLFEGDYRESVFVSEPVHNAIHREVLKRNGVSFNSHRARAETDREFLASSDPWFRPTGMKTGPDGALYVADMYRLVIEHPEWIPDDVASKIDLRTGENLGRIYRIYPSARRPKLIPQLANDSSEELVSRLESSNGWVRDTAQRLLVEQGEEIPVAGLRKLLNTSDLPKATLHALWTLDGLGSLGIQDVLVGLRSVSGEVRRNSVRLAERFFQDVHFQNIRRDGPVDNRPRVLLHELFQIANDPWHNVRLQLILSLGVSSNPVLGDLLYGLARRETLPELKLAIEASLPRHLDRVIESALIRPTLVAGEIPDYSAQPDFYSLLIRYALIQRHPENVRKLVAALLASGDSGDRLATFKILQSYTLELKKQGLSDDSDFDCWANSLTHWDSRTAEWRARILEIAKEEGADRSLGDVRRGAAIKLTMAVSSGFEGMGAVLSSLESSALQLDVLRSIRVARPSQVLPDIKGAWAGLRPLVRELVIQQWIKNERTLESLLEEINEGDWTGLLESIPIQRVLRASRSPALVSLVKAEGGAETSSIGDFSDTLASVFSLRPDQSNGLALFNANCASCHRLGETGHHVGPDLRTISDRSTRGLLQAIVVPNKSVEAKFVAYNIETRSGESLTGIIKEETGNGLILRIATGEERALLRKEIESISGSGLSLMPEGLAEQIGTQGLSDLIGFLQQQ